MYLTLLSVMVRLTGADCVGAAPPLAAPVTGSPALAAAPLAPSSALLRGAPLPPTIGSGLLRTAAP